MTTATATLGDAIRYLAARCDGAVTDDARGFNGTDAGFGGWLAGIAEQEWTPEQKRAAWELLRKYRRQLAGGGIEYDEIPEPAPVASSDPRRTAQQQRAARNAEARKASSRVIDAGKGELTVSFAYDADLVAACRSLPGRRWDAARKTNTFPVTPAARAALRDFAERHDFRVTDAAAALLADAPEYKPLPERRAELAGDRIALYFPRDGELLDRVRAIEGRRWDPDGVRWTVPVEAGPLATVKALADDAGFVLADDVAALIADYSKKAAAAEKRAAALADASRAMAGSKDIECPPGLALRPFQVAGVEYALHTRRCFIADDMGTGKTIQALIAVREADAFPVVCVVRSSIKRKWADEAKRWLPGRKVVVLGGTKPDPAAVEGADVIIINYDVLSAWAGVAAADFVKRGSRHKGEHEPGLLCQIGVRALIVDESHYGKTPDAKRTRALIVLAHSIPADGLVLNLTGTPVLNRPIELAAQLAILGRLGDFGGYWRFARRYCGAYMGSHGMDVTGSANEVELHERLRGTCFIRRTKDQVLPDLPAIQIARLPLEIDNEAEYREAEANVIGWVREQVEQDEGFLAEIADLPEDEQRQRIAARKSEKEHRARAAEELVRLNALRRIAARGKLAQVADWVEDFLESSEEKLVIFAHHRDIQNELASRFGALRIHADDNELERHAQATAFQADPDKRVIVCSMEAAREGIDLFAASNVLFVEYGWNAKIHEQAEARVHRIGQEAESITAWYTLAEGTIDEAMHELIEAKRAVSDSVTDGKVAERSVSIAREVMDRLKARALAA